MTYTIPPLVPIEPITIDVKSITTGTLDGSGDFDVLMRTARVHLLEELTSGRIKVAEYGSIYLGTMSQLFQQSMEFALKSDETSLRLQILQMEYQLALLNRDKVIAEIEMIHKQMDVADVQMVDMRQNTALTKAKTDITVIELAGVHTKNANLILEGKAVEQDILLKIEQTDNLKNSNGFS